MIAPANDDAVASAVTTSAPSAVVAIGRLRAVRQRLLDLDDAAAQWLAAVIGEYESGARHGMTLDEAAGLAPGVGQDSWFVSEARARRDALLREIAALLPAGMSTRAATREIRKQALRYEATAWLRERPLLTSRRSRTRLRGLLFALLKCAGTTPSSRTIERVLGATTRKPLASGLDLAGAPQNWGIPGTLDRASSAS